MTKEYDLIVIGTGAAGSTVAYECNSAGLKVAIVDSRPFGGTCALRGCDPKKVLVGAAEIIDRSLSMRENGISNEIDINWPELMKFKRTFTDPVPESRGRGFSGAGIDAFNGIAKFTGKNTLKIGDETITGNHILIATGAKPRKLNIPGEEYVSLSEQFLEMDNLPESMTFIGGGYISFEFAHVAARAGSKVRILHRSDRPLKKFDPDLVDAIIKASQEMGIEVQLNMPVNSIEKKSGKLVVHAGDKEFESDMVVHGAGRVPAIDDLDLEKAEIEVDKRGIVVNEYLQSVSNPAVYVAGDANGRGVPLTPVASMEGRIVAKNILEGNTTTPDYTAIPSVVFTTPPLASVGMQEEEAKKQGINYRKNYQDTSSWYTSRRIGLKNSGFKVLVDEDTNRIIGVHLLGHNAEEVINIFALAMRANISLEDIKNIIWGYPTSSSDINYMI